MRWLIGLLISFFMMLTSLEAGTLADPTKPLGTITTVGYELGDILISKTLRSAVINNKIYHIGDMLGNSKVIDIRPNSVDLQGPNGKITLTLLRFSIKLLN